MNFAHIDTNSLTIIKKLREHPRADGGPVVGLIPGTTIVPIQRPDIPPEVDTRTHHATRVEKVTPTSVVMEWQVTPMADDELTQSVQQIARGVIAEQINVDDVLEMYLDDLADEKPTKAEKDRQKAVANWSKAVRKESKAKIKAIADGDPYDLDQWPEFTP